MAELFTPIAYIKELIHWESVPIVECGEKLISLNKLPEKYFVQDLKYYHQGVPGAINEGYSRTKVFDLLMEAAGNLPNGYKFLIWDAWRPIGVQEFLFNEYLTGLTPYNPGLDILQLEKLARQFVSPPSRDARKPSPHNTGGAIDISLMDDSGIELDMNTSFDSFSPESGTRFFEEKQEKGEKLSPRERIYRDNRRLLYHLMTAAGFTNFPNEWWHYDYGNQFWGCRTHNKACYVKITI